MMNDANFLVTFKPLDEFAFGMERNFKYEGLTVEGQVSYFVRSSYMPEQTTILGSLRYAVLANKKLIRSDFQYRDDKEKVTELIGGESFDFNKDNQKFGVIESISPVFLINQGKGQKEYIIRNPLNNKAQGHGLLPMKLGSEKITTSYGAIRLPDKGQYDAKSGLSENFINLETGEILEDIFQSHIITGNRKNGYQGNRKEGFFKREVYYVKNGQDTDYRFAVIVRSKKDALPCSCYLRMGQKGAAFLMEAEEIGSSKDSVSKLFLERTADKLKNLISGGEEAGNTKCFYYAISDLILQEESRYKTFCIVNKKSLRNLSTDLKNGKLRRFDKQYNLIEAGSVFYENRPVLSGNKNHESFGYNYVIEVGLVCDFTSDRRKK